jgi:hypothetical protein
MDQPEERTEHSECYSNTVHIYESVLHCAVTLRQNGQVCTRPKTTVFPNVKFRNQLLTAKNYELSPQSLLCTTMEGTSRVLLTVSLLWPAYDIAGNAVHYYS